MSNRDYASNFEELLDQVNEGSRFVFGWALMSHIGL